MQVFDEINSKNCNHFVQKTADNEEKQNDSSSPSNQGQINTAFSTSENIEATTKM